MDTQCSAFDPPTGTLLFSPVHVAQVAVSPYLVGAKEQYEHAKHIVGADIVAALVRNPSAPLPKGLIEVRILSMAAGPDGAV